MILTFGFIFYTYSCVIITKVQSDSTAPWSEDLVDGYYNMAPTMTNEYIPQDEKDAKIILDSEKNKEVIASILLHRDKIRRFAIGHHIVEKYEYNKKIITYEWIEDTYRPQLQPPYKDLYYCLIKPESMVIGAYLSNFLNNKDEAYIIIGMILTKDIQNMIQIYDSFRNKGYRFKNLRKAQREPFEHMMRVWVRHNREPIENGELNHDSITKAVDALKEEQKNCGWGKNRDQLELILMKKSIKFARAVMEEFEKANDKKPIEEIINGCVQSCKLDQGLANAYSSLAKYVKDKYTYIVDLLCKNAEGADRWAVWFMCIAVIHPQEWPKLDEVFKKDHKDDSLSKLILRKVPDDKVMAEMMAAMVDPKFKPTTFPENPSEVDSKKPVR